MREMPNPGARSEIGGNVGIRSRGFENLYFFCFRLGLRIGVGETLAIGKNFCPCFDARTMHCQI